MMHGRSLIPSLRQPLFEVGRRMSVGTANGGQVGQCALRLFRNEAVTEIAFDQYVVIDGCP
jgi:hypothetical protein